MHASLTCMITPKARDHSFIDIVSRVNNGNLNRAKIYIVLIFLAERRNKGVRQK